MPKMKGLKINRFENYVLKDFGDLVVALAGMIEDAKVMAGVQDYTAKECFDQAFPMAREMWMRNDGGEWAMPYFDKEDIEPYAGEEAKPGPARAKRSQKP